MILAFAAAAGASAPGASAAREGAAAVAVTGAAARAARTATPPGTRFTWYAGRAPGASSTTRTLSPERPKRTCANPAPPFAAARGALPTP